MPVTHVLVDTWVLTVKLVYELSDVPDDLKWATNTHDTIYTNFQGINNNIYGVGRPFFPPSFFYPSTHISARPYSFLPVLMTGGRVSTYSMLWYLQLCSANQVVGIRMYDFQVTHRIIIIAFCIQPLVLLYSGA